MVNPLQYFHGLNIPSGGEPEADSGGILRSVLLASFVMGGVVWGLAIWKVVDLVS